MPRRQQTPYLRLGILEAFDIIIRYSLVSRERVAWHLENVGFRGMAYLLSSGI